MSSPGISHEIRRGQIPNFLHAPPSNQEEGEPESFYEPQGLMLTDMLLLGAASLFLFYGGYKLYRYMGSPALPDAGTVPMVTVPRHLFEEIMNSPIS